MSSFRSLRVGISMGKDIEPLIQVAPKGTRSDGSLQVAIGRQQPAHRTSWNRFLRRAQIRVPEEPAKERSESLPEVRQLRPGRSCLSLPVQSVLNDAESPP